MSISRKNRMAVADMCSWKVGRRIWILRFHNKMQRAELAKAVGIETTVLDAIEHCRMEPDRSLLERIADFFQVHPEELANV